MLKKIIISLILVIILLPSINSTIHEGKIEWWDENWSYRQEIKIPFDTGLPEGKYQPIDTRIKFKKTCWAKNVNEHSVRVILSDGNNLIELESQIYDLEYTDSEHISECSLVFIIPEEASGGERYYVYYDDEEKKEPNYPDHIQIKETYYRYEILPGYAYESHCYKITEDGYIVYAIAQKGEILGIGTSQQVMKFKPRSKKLVPSNGETIAFFDFWYYYDKGNNDYKSTCEKLISKDVFVDGNLMVACNLVSRSNEEDMETSALYKYYYCPQDDKRIHAHLEHEVLKEGITETYDFYDGSYASLQTGGIKSNTIEEINVGEILPYIHTYTEENMVKEFSLYTDPEYSEGEWNIPILTTFDDIDLGNQAWACYDQGKKGIAHSLILDSTSVVQSGDDEKDGVQLQIYETGYPDLPGLENNVASFQLGRNSYERGLSHDRKIPKGFKVDLDVDFFSTQTGGYTKVAEEASIFQNLAENIPENIKQDNSKNNEKTLYSLKTHVFLAPSIPLGTILSTLTSKNFSYITGEIYKDGNFIQSNIASRLSFNQIPDLKDKKFIEKIKLLLGVFDFKNSTILKKVIFRNLEPGNYLVKIYINNPFFGERKEFIGYRFVNLTEDSTSNIFCTREAKINFLVIDQDKNSIENVKILLLEGDKVINKDVSDSNGEVTINAPCKIKDNYLLKMIYDGFLIHEEEIRLGLPASFSTVEKTRTIDVYDFKIKIADTWGLPPGVRLNPYFTSENMIEQIKLTGEINSPGSFQFIGLIPGTYTFNINFKSEKIKEKIIIPDEKEKNIVFPLEYKIETRVFNSRGNKLNNIRLEFSRDDKKKTFNIDDDGVLDLNLPPGNYTTKIYDNNNMIGARKIKVLGERSVNLVTRFEPMYPLFITICAVLSGIAAVYYLIKKKRVNFFLKILVLILLIVSIAYPWWSQNGSKSEIETSTSLYVGPVKLVTLTSSPDVIAGNLASLPDIFLDAINSVFVLTVVSCIIIALTFIIDRFQKTRLSQILIAISFILLVSSLALFVYSMSELSNITVGGFMGEGTMETSIIGEGKSEMIPTVWGPDTGFLIYLTAVFLLFFTTLKKIKNIQVFHRK